MQKKAPEPAIRWQDGAYYLFNRSRSEQVLAPKE